MLYIQEPRFYNPNTHNNNVSSSTDHIMQLDHNLQLKEPLQHTQTLKPILKPIELTATRSDNAIQSTQSRWYLSVSVGGRGKIPATTPLLPAHNESEHTFIPVIYTSASATQHIQSMSIAQPSIVPVPIAQPVTQSTVNEPSTTPKRVKSEHTQAIESSGISSKKSKNDDIEMLSSGHTTLSSIDEGYDSSGSDTSESIVELASNAAAVNNSVHTQSINTLTERQPAEQSTLNSQSPSTPSTQQQYQIGNNQPELTESDIAVVRCGDSDSEELYTCSSFGQDSFFVACHSTASNDSITPHSTSHNDDTPSNVLAIGIADGVGGWRSKGVDSGIMSRDLMHHAELAVRNKVAATPLNIMNDAYNNVHREGMVEAGSTTACILTITPAKQYNDTDTLRDQYSRQPSHTSTTSLRAYSSTRELDDDLTLSEPSHTRSISTTSGSNTPVKTHRRVNSNSSVFSTFSPSHSQRHSRNLSNMSNSSIGSTESLMDAFNQRINVDSATSDSTTTTPPIPDTEPPRLPLQQQRTDNSPLSQQDEAHTSDIPTAILHSANLGDSGWVVIRDGKIVARSEFQRTGMTVKQMAVIPPRFRDPALRLCDDKPSDSVLQSYVLLEGDTIVLGSDGLWDNLVQPEHVLIPFVLGLLRVPVPQASDKIQLAMNQQIESLVRSVIQTQPQDLAKAIADTLTRHAVRFMNTQDGKPDDICLLAAQLKRCNVTDTDDASITKSFSESNIADQRAQ